MYCSGAWLIWLSAARRLAWWTALFVAALRWTAPSASSARSASCYASDASMAAMSWAAAVRIIGVTMGRCVKIRRSLH